MRFGPKRGNRIKIANVTYFDLETKTIFFDILTEKNGEKRYYKDLFINLKQPVSGKPISENRKFSLRINNYHSALRALEIKFFTPKSSKKVDEDVIYLVSVSLDF